MRLTEALELAGGPTTGPVRPACWAAILALALLACTKPPATQTVGTTPPSKRLAASGPANGPKSSPRLVVSVVFDQLGSDTLARHIGLLSERGAVRTGIERGFFAERVRYTHATTLTAPNHAAIYTGATPSASGITGNLLRTPDGKARTSVDDGTHKVHNSKPGVFAGPAALRVDTVGDALKRHTNGRGKVVSLSLKDRAAILPAGKHPDMAIWYDTAVPGFTTSTYYATELPAWLARFKEEYPVADLLQPWVPEAPQELSRHLGADAAPGEGHYHGWTDTFPHDPNESTRPYGVLRLTPGLTDHLLSLASAAIDAYELGADEVADLLAISISGPDYVGHVFGPDSWEYVDHLRRADAALGRFLDELSGRLSVAVLVTSDHGVCRLPEELSDGHSQPRVASRALREAAEGAIRRELGSLVGAGPWTLAFAPPYLYLTEAARTHPKRDAIVAAAVRGVSEVTHTHAAFDVQQLVRAAKTSLERDIAASIHPEASGDIYVVHERHTIDDLGIVQQAGTTHGSPWDYDREVPGIVWGPGVPRGRVTSPLQQTRVAATLASLLGIPAPDPQAPPPLYELVNDRTPSPAR